MKTYIVVKGQQDADILRTVLPAPTLRTIQFVIGGSKSSGVSLARSLISDRGEPLLLVMDADTNNNEAIIEQEKEVQELLGAVAINAPYDVILAIPELEIVFFYDPIILANTLQLTLDHEAGVNGVYAPRKTLHELIQKSPSYIQNEREFLQRLDQTARDHIAHHPLIQKIVTFVTNSEAISAI